MTVTQPRLPCEPRRRQRGMTLIELLIAVAIVGILASIGYPAYTEYAVRVNRQQAMADLLNTASLLERYKAVKVSYTGAGDKDIFNAWSPADRPVGDKKYQIKLLVAKDGRSYVLTAEPVSGTKQASDGIIYYYSNGLKAWDANADTKLSEGEMVW